MLNAAVSYLLTLPSINCKGKNKQVMSQIKGISHLQSEPHPYGREPQCLVISGCHITITALSSPLRDFLEIWHSSWSGSIHFDQQGLLTRPTSKSHRGQTEDSNMPSRYNTSSMTSDHWLGGLRRQEGVQPGVQKGRVREALWGRRHLRGCTGKDSLDRKGLGWCVGIRGWTGMRRHGGTERWGGLSGAQGLALVAGGDGKSGRGRRGGGREPGRQWRLSVQASGGLRAVV